MTDHLFWKATNLGGLYRGVPLYFWIFISAFYLLPGELTDYADALLYDGLKILAVCNIWDLCCMKQVHGVHLLNITSINLFSNWFGSIIALFCMFHKISSALLFFLSIYVYFELYGLIISYYTQLCDSKSQRLLLGFLLDQITFMWAPLYLIAKCKRDMASLLVMHWDPVTDMD